MAKAISVTGKPRSNENGPMKRPKVCRIPIAALRISAPAMITSVVWLSGKAKRLLLAVDMVLISFDTMVAASVRRGKGNDFDDR